MKRRQVLRLGLQGGVTLAAAKAIHNVFLGYGRIGPGTNLRVQDLDRVAADRFSVPNSYWGSVDGHDLVLDDERLWVGDDDDSWTTIDLDADAPERALEVDDRFGFETQPLTELTTDLESLRVSAYTFEFHDVDGFFDRIAASTSRPYTADLLRGRRYRTADPATVERFTDVSPTDPRALLEGFVPAFRRWTSYDVPRYVAGSVEDNVLFSRVELRRHFQPEATFEAIMAADGVGLFCWEFTFLANEALHSLPAHEQQIPLLGCWVRDRRHKHIYNAFASVIRADGELVIPVSFVDYTHTTLYDDLSLTWLLGEGFDAYDTSHRADELYWDRF